MSGGEGIIVGYGGHRKRRRNSDDLDPRTCKSPRIATVHAERRPVVNLNSTRRHRHIPHSNHYVRICFGRHSLRTSEKCARVNDRNPVVHLLSPTRRTWHRKLFLECATFLPPSPSQIHGIPAARNPARFPFKHLPAKRSDRWVRRDD